MNPDHPDAPRSPATPPWEQTSARAEPDEAPWERAAPSAPQPPQWTPPKKSGFSIFPRTRGRQILVGVFGFVFLVVGPVAFKLQRVLREDAKETRVEEAEERQGTLKKQQRTEAEALVQQAADLMKTKYDAGRDSKSTVLATLQRMCAAGEFQTPNHELRQVNATRNARPDGGEVILICTPKSSAADTDYALYGEFRWTEGLIKTGWK